MAGEMLLINPRRRRKTSAKRRPAARRRRNPIATRKSIARRPPMVLSRSRRRRRNPISNLRIGRRRRRNPIAIGGLTGKGIVTMLKDAALGGAGGIAMDLIMGQVNPYLPASFQTVKGQVSVGDAVKAALTALLGHALRKPTKGLSLKLAQGSLTVQAYELLGVLVPEAMPVGFASPARIIQGSARVGPTRGGMLQAYMKPNNTALLNAYQRPGGPTAILGRAGSALKREGVSTYR